MFFGQNRQGQGIYKQVYTKMLRVYEGLARQSSLYGASCLASIRVFGSSNVHPRTSKRLFCSLQGIRILSSLFQKSRSVRFPERNKTSLVDCLTLEKTTEALDKVKSEFETESGALAIIRPDCYDKAIEIMANHFTVDEPLCQAFGVTWNKDLEKIVLDKLKNNISIGVVSKDTGEIMGVVVSGLIRKTDPPPNFSDMECERLKRLLTFLTHKDDEVNFFERYKVDEAVYAFTLGVKKTYRRMELGGNLVAATVALSRELGFKVIKGEATSKFSDKIGQKQGWEILLKIPYDSYYYNGRPISDSTGEHTMVTIYALKIE